MLQPAVVIGRSVRCRRASAGRTWSLRRFSRRRRPLVRRLRCITISSKRSNARTSWRRLGAAVLDVENIQIFTRKRRTIRELRLKHRLQVALRKLVILFSNALVQPIGMLHVWAWVFYAL